jgi:hypothetical protein
MNKKPPRPVNAVIAIRLAPLNGMLRKNRGSMSGSGWCSSWRTSIASATADSATHPTIRGEPQPAPGPSMIA